MARDKRWPVGWFFFLLELHMSILIALAGLSGSQMVDSRSNNVWLLIWMLAAAVTAILVLTIHEICLCCGRLSPGWTLSWYLLISLVWVTVVIVFAFSEMDPTYRGDCVTYKPTIGEYRNRTSCFIYTIDLALMIVVTICCLTSIIIFIFTCVIVHRNRRRKQLERLGQTNGGTVNPQVTNGQPKVPQVAHTSQQYYQQHPQQPQDLQQPLQQPPQQQYYQQQQGTYGPQGQTHSGWVPNSSHELHS